MFIKDSLNGVPFPKYTMDDLYSMLPDDPYYASDHAAIDSIACIELLLKMTGSLNTVSSKDAQLVIGIIRINFGILVDIVYSVDGLPMSSSNNSIVLKHEIVISERLMQNNDLEIMRTCCDRQSIEQVLTGSQRYDITEKGWFIDEDCAPKK